MERTISNAMGGSLRLLSELANTPIMAKLGLTGSVEKLLYRGSKLTVQTALGALKQSAPVVKLLKPERMPRDEKEVKPDGFDLTLTDSQELVRDTMARFASDRIRKAALEADEACSPPAGFLDEANEIGVTQLAVPEALGGAGDARSVTTNVLVAEELARGDMGLALAAMAPLGVVHALVDFGTAEQQGTYLPRFVGERFYPAALALHEPRALFNPRYLATRATPDGDSYVLTGEKSLVPLAADAELLLVVADVAGAPQAFLIEKGTPGLTVTAEPTMGIRAAKLGRVKLDHVRVPRANLLGGESGLDLDRLLDLSRIAWGAMCVGACAAVLDYVKTYCVERIAFGEPIAHRQSVAFMIADIAIELEGMRLMVYRAASRAEHGRSFSREAALVAVQCGEKGMQIGTNGVQLLGGHGFIKEHPVELWYRHLRSIGIIEGALLV